jgi:UDP-glucuronate 4-epimerase
MQILVTGAAGFIGSHLCELLSSVPDVQVIGLDNFNEYYAPAIKRQNAEILARHSIPIIQADLCDLDEIQTTLKSVEFTHVVHLAAKAGVRSSVQNPQSYLHQNLASTVNILELARTRNVARFVFTSSSTVYGADAAPPFEEDDILGVPESPYGASKRACEVIIESYSRTYSLPHVVLRPFSVYGPRMRPDLAMSIFSEAIVQGEPLTVFGDGSSLRGFTHVRDICRGIVASLTSDSAVGQAINLGGNQQVTVKQLIQSLETGLGKTAVVQFMPNAKGDVSVTWASMQKSKNLLGYAPTINFSQGVQEFCSWFVGQRSTT